MMDAGTITILIFIVLVASILQASTGFGFSIMATPFLLLVFEPHAAIQINIILSILLSVVMIPKIYKDLDRATFLRLLIGSVAGLPLGIVFYVFMDVHWLKIFISVLILAITMILLFNFKLKQTHGRDRSAGMISGLLTTSIGMPGPPLIIYFSGVGTEKAKLRGTILAYYVWIYLSSFVMQITVSGKLETLVWTASLLSIPVVLLGTALGQRFFIRLNQHMFQRIAYALLFFTGSYLLVTSLI